MASARLDRFVFFLSCSGVPYIGSNTGGWGFGFVEGGSAEGVKADKLAIGEIFLPHAFLFGSLIFLFE